MSQFQTIYRQQNNEHYKSDNDLSPQDGPAPPLPSIEVSPGLDVPLRGARETMEAISNDFFLPTCCVSCDSTIICILDANYILCPKCRVVSPLEGLHEGMRDGCHGVGLGVSLGDLAAMSTF